MFRRLLFFFLIVFLLLSVYIFFPRGMNLPSFAIANKGDLELFLSLPYRFEANATPVFARNEGVVVPLASEGEKVEAGTAICLVQGKSTVSYEAPRAGIVSAYTPTKNQLVQSGDYLFEILPVRASLLLFFTLEQFKKVEGRKSLQLELPFSPERTWGDFVTVSQEDDRWVVQILVMDFLDRLSRQKEGQLKAFYGWERGKLIIPTGALKAEEGVLGVSVLTGVNERKFVPVRVCAVSGFQVAVEGLAPGDQVINEGK